MTFRWARATLGIRKSPWEERLCLPICNTAIAAVLYGPLVLARDAEFTAVGTPVHPTDLQLDITDRLTDDAILRAQVTLGGNTFPMADYASCGKDWSETSRMEAWLPTV